MIIGDDEPQHAVARLPKRDSRGRLIVARRHGTGQHHRSASRTSRAHSNGDGYSPSYYYGSSDGSRPSRDWDDGDSWSGRGGGRVKSGYWSEGGDSWDEHVSGRRPKRIENGRRDGRRGYYLN
jgi:hypothetical protein